jgi:acyl-CoA thioesterase
VNVKATLSSDDVARACAEAMWKEEEASGALGMRIVKIGAGRTTLTMTVRPDLVNGQRIAPGGFIFAVADSAFAFACNSHNQRAVTAQDSITFVKPRKLGDVLVANAKQISREPAVWHPRCAGHRGR